MMIRLQTTRLFAAVVCFASSFSLTAGEHCCSWNLKDCEGGGAYCKESASNCENCLLHWIDTAQNDATCVSRLEGGCTSHEDCCGDGKMACIGLMDQYGEVYMGCDIPTCCSSATVEDCIPGVADYSAFCNYAEANCADEQRCPGSSWVDRNQTCCSWDLKKCNPPNTFCDSSEENCEDSCFMHWIYSDLTMANGCTARLHSCGGHDECCGGGGKMGCFERPDPQIPGSHWTACDLRACCSTDGMSCMFEENSDYCNYSPANCQACAGTWLERPIPTCPASGTPVATPTSTCVIGTRAPTICESGMCGTVPTEKPTHTPTETPTETPTLRPSTTPSVVPSEAPTDVPTGGPTGEPTGQPTDAPTEPPTTSPTGIPTNEPTEMPTKDPTKAPSASPTGIPTPEPTETPTGVPTESPTLEPTASPTTGPTEVPTERPTAQQAPEGTPTSPAVPTTPRFDPGPEAIVEPAIPVSEMETCYSDPSFSTCERITGRSWYDNVEHNYFPFYLNRGAFNAILGGDSIIGGALYTFSKSTLKISVLFAPLYQSETKQARLVLRKMEDASVVVDTTADITINIWHCLFRVNNLPQDEAYTYEIYYHPNPNDANIVFTYSGSIPVPVFNPRVVVIGCFGADNTVDKSDLLEKAQAHDPHIVIYNGDQTYRHPELSFGFFETVWSLNELTKNVPTITQMDDHDYGQGNIWGAGRDPDEESGAGFTEKPPCLVNALQRQVMGHLPDSPTTETLTNSITIHYTNIVYGQLDFAVLEARKFKSLNNGPAASLLGEDQELWLSSWCHDSDTDKVKVVLAQTPFASIATHRTHYHYGGIIECEGEVDPDPNGYPKPARDKAIDIITGCSPLVISGDQHVGAVVSYGTSSGLNPIYDCAAPAAINSIFWRLNLNDVNASHIDQLGNEYFLHAVWNIPMNFIDQYSLPYHTIWSPSDAATKQERGDGFMTVYFKDDNAFCVAQSYRTDPTVRFNVTVPLFTQK